MDGVGAALRVGRGVVTYQADGEGAPVVAVHGLPGSARDFRRLLGAASGVRMIRLNLPGFAGSTPVEPKGDWEGLIEVVVEAARELAGGPFVLLGHSFGAFTVLQAAARCAEVRGVALLAPAGLRAHAGLRSLGPLWWLKALTMSWVTREGFYRGMLRTPMGKHASRLESDVTLGLLASADFAAVRAAVASLRVPVFCASCLDDELVEPEIVAELLSALNTQQWLEFERGGHAPQREYAAEIGAALVGFANGCV